MTGLVKNLRDAVKKLAYSTSVDQLKKQGVNKVNVLGVDRIALLIQEAVKKSLRFKLLAMDREEIANATKDEFLRLLKSNEALEREHDELRSLKEAAEAQVDELRRELGNQQKILDDKLASANADSKEVHQAQDQELAGQIQELVLGLQESGQTEDMPERVMALVMGALTDERRKATEAEEAIHDKEVVNLQRRIEKLTNSLNTTEQRLAEVAAIKNIDPGISSVFKEVQGLNNEDKQFGAKSALMSSIFEANLALQGK